MDETSGDGESHAITRWEEDGMWVIRDERSGVTTQGETQLRALLMLADALAAYYDSDEDLMELAEDVFIPDEEMAQFLDDLGYSDMADDAREYAEKHRRD